MTNIAPEAPEAAPPDRGAACQAAKPGQSRWLGSRHSQAFYSVPLPPAWRSAHGRGVSGRADIPVLTGHFLQQFNALYRKSVRLSPGLRDCLFRYPFPGNVRQLENLVHRLVALAREEVVDERDLPEEFCPSAPPRPEVDLAPGAESPDHEPV